MRELLGTAAGVYAIVNQVTGGIYIGSSQCIIVRLDDHFSALRLGKHGNRHLQNAYNRNGRDAFYCDLVEQTEPIEAVLIEREDYWLGAGTYNIAKRADRPPSPRGRPLREETREKMRKVQRETPRTPGQQAAQKKAIAAAKIANTGRKATAETRQRISKARLALPIEVRQANGLKMKGWVPTQAQRDHLSLLYAGREMPLATRKKISVTLAEYYRKLGRPPGKRRDKK